MGGTSASIALSKYRIDLQIDLQIDLSVCIPHLQSPGGNKWTCIPQDSFVCMVQIILMVFRTWWTYDGIVLEDR